MKISQKSYKQKIEIKRIRTEFDISIEQMTNLKFAWPA